LGYFRIAGYTSGNPIYQQLRLRFELTRINFAAWRVVACKRIPCRISLERGKMENVSDLASGSLLGHYRIVRRLGQGGMGVVYEAVDQKLGRHVAVKLISEASRDSSQSLDRIWREARAASSLNHPGICTVHELNESAQSPFIVMELLDGDTLEKFFRNRPMPFPRLVELGVQLADALDAAHGKGILHRDIKPANIFMTKSGQVKLLDFGLAKLDSAASSSPAAANASTAASPLTSTGSLLGTVAFMSPEQARGEPLDARTDLFSLGVVLYETATGQHPFAGTTTAVVFDKILNHQPISPSTLNAQLPVEFENILNKTLEKDRELRCQSAAELRADLKRLQRKAGLGPVAAPHAAGPAISQSSELGTGDRARSTAGWNLSGAKAARPEGASAALRKSLRAAIAFVIVLAVGFAAWRFWPRPKPFSSISVNQITNIGTIERITLSADGRFLAEVKNDNGQRTLWARNTATNTDTQILGAIAADYLGLTFSPDGNYLYFTRGTPQDEILRDLYVMSVFGGTPRQLIANVDGPVSLTPGGDRLAYVRWLPERKDEFSEVHIVDKEGGNEQVLYTSMELLQPPVWSPDGSRIAWLQTEPGTTRNALSVMEISSKKLTTLAAPAEVSFENPNDGYTTLAWLPDNRHLLALYDKLHTDRAQIGIITIPSGEFHSVTNDVNSYSQLALSGDGHTLATVLTSIDSSIAFYGSDGGAPVSTMPLRISPSAIAWASEDRLLFIVKGASIGSIDRATGSVHNFDAGEITPGEFIAACADGEILFTGIPRSGGEARLFRMSGDGGGITQLTTNGMARNPSCSRDSKVAYFSLGTDVDVSLWSVPLAGGTAKNLVPPDNYHIATVFRDGKQAVLFGLRQNKFSAMIADLDSGRKQPPVLVDKGMGNVMGLSPDNRAFVADILQDGGATLLVQPFDGSPAHSLFKPVPETLVGFDWSPSGKQLAVMRLKSSSDVVFIIDQSGKETHSSFLVCIFRSCGPKS
jgi:serine/threonine protein kinase/Tol biopolymer transport system component